MRKTGDAIAGIFCILIGIAVIIGSVPLRLGTPTEPEPGFFPFINGVALTVLSLVLLLYAWRGRSTGMAPFGQLRRPAILVVGLFVYSVILDPVGYIVATVMLAAVVLRVMNVRRIWKIATISLVVSVASYILFDRLLGIMLPPGILEAFIG
jgi:putative tricarboxylic transport membrane protein